MTDLQPEPDAEPWAITDHAESLVYTMPTDRHNPASLTVESVGAAGEETRSTRTTSDRSGER
jgi:hypothetical protein